MKSKNNIFSRIKREVIEMSKTSSKDELRQHECNIMIEVTKCLAFCAFLIVAGLAFFWEINTVFMVFNSVLLITFLIILSYMQNSSWSLKIKTHIFSIMICTEYLILYFLLYNQITFLFWLSLLLAFIPTTIISRKITFEYLILIFIFTIYMSVSKNGELYFKNDIAFIIAFIFIYLLLLVIFYFIKMAFEVILISKDEYIEKIGEQNKLIIEQNNELYKLAHRDFLADLPNRQATIKVLNQLVEKKDEFYLLYMDLDDFKSINDSLNHFIGDKFLAAFSERIRLTIDENDFFSRMGGDEFAIIISRNLTKNELNFYIENILDVLEEPIKVGKYRIKIKLSGGVTKFPDDAKNPSDLLKTVDTAMYKAKNSKNTICFYKKEFGEEILEKIKMENHLLKALKRNEFRLVYQPIVSSKDGSVVSFESLIRWNSKKFGNIPPSIFVPIAERLGIIHEMGFFVIESAVKMAKKLELNNYDAYINVNVSAIQLKNPNFIGQIKKIIEKTKVNSKYLAFEFTESTFIDNDENTKKVIRAIKEMGIRTAIDDFGTGYSSFGYLPKLPIDILKIDKIFIDEIGMSEENNALLNAIISIGHIFKMKVVAEGVEKKEQFEYLKEIGCDLVQGYLFSKPVEENKVFDSILLR